MLAMDDSRALHRRALVFVASKQVSFFHWPQPAPAPQRLPDGINARWPLDFRLVRATNGPEWRQWTARAQLADLSQRYMLCWCDLTGKLFLSSIRA